MDYTVWRSALRGSRWRCLYSCWSPRGDFSEGWSLPFEFFWHAEHGLAIVWILAVAGGLHGAVTRRNRSNVPLAAVLFIYGTLVIASVGFEIFVVYGRTARQLVPFLSLIAAEQLYRAARTVPRMNRTIRVAAALILVQTLVNWRTPFSQIFPAEFRDRARTIAAAQGSERIDFLFVEHIYPVPALKLREEMTPILRTPHPLEFLPYQYEGYSPRDRAVLRAADISMRAVASR